MKAATCRLCGKAHWGNCFVIADQPVANGIANSVANSRPVTRKEALTVAKKIIADAEAECKPLKRSPKYRDLEKRRAYMKDFMRRKRAAKTETQETK